MMDPQIARKDGTTIEKNYDGQNHIIDHRNMYSTRGATTTLKIFTLSTTIGTCHFGVEDTTEFLVWHQAMNRYCRLNAGRNTFGPNLSVNGKSRNSKLFTDDQQQELDRLI